jgi:hypothetical protein
MPVSEIGQRIAAAGAARAVSGADRFGRATADSSMTSAGVTIKRESNALLPELAKRVSIAFVREGGF